MADGIWIGIGDGNGTGPMPAVAAGMGWDGWMDGWLEIMEGLIGLWGRRRCRSSQPLPTLWWILLGFQGGGEWIITHKGQGL